MTRLDWDQPAKLKMLRRNAVAGGDRPHNGAPIICKGSLREAITAYAGLPPLERHSARLELKWGFHLDGLEIADLESAAR